MKKISVVIPTYNEQENVVAIHDAVSALFAAQGPLAGYGHEILFIDNKSKDQTRALIALLCRQDPCTRAIFNARNFGQFNSPYYGLLQSDGDCAVLLAADFQDPPDMIPRFVEEWERGFRIVIGQKTDSGENRLMYLFRTAYYKILKKMSDVEQIEHFTGFGLYDQTFIQVLAGLSDSRPYLRGIVAELGFERREIPYRQEKRRAGKSSNHFFTLYDAAMLGITSYTKTALRVATIFGFICSGVSLLVSLAYLVLKLCFWSRFPLGTAPELIGIFFMGSLQLFFIGFLGEYIFNINARVMNRPLVVEEERIPASAENPEAPVVKLPPPPGER